MNPALNLRGLAEVGTDQGGSDGQGVVVPKGPEELCPLQMPNRTVRTELKTDRIHIPGRDAHLGSRAPVGTLQ